MSVNKFMFEDMEYDIQSFIDCDMHDLASKSNILIKSENKIYTQKTGIVDFTEYVIEGSGKERFAYELIRPHGDCFECDIVTTDTRQDDGKMYDVIFAYLNSPMNL